MALPSVKHCIVAGTVRHDPGPSITLLGFLGVAPDVSLACRKFPAQLEVSFLFLGEVTDTARYQLSLWIEDGEGNAILPPEQREIATTAGKPMEWAIGTVAKYPHPGKYTLHAMLGNEIFDLVTFEVKPHSATDAT